MAPARDTAICLREAEWSETSQIATLFTREHGIVRGIARGAKRERGSFAGGIDLLCLGELLWVSKPAGQLDTLTSWSALEFFASLGRSWPRWTQAMYLAQMTSAMLREDDPHPGVFDSLIEVLRDGSEAPARAALGFQWTLLRHTGLAIELDADAISRESLGDAEIVDFMPARGGFTLHAPASETRWRVRMSTIEALRRVSTGDHTGEIEPIRRGVRFMHACLTHVLGRELSAWEAFGGCLSEEPTG